MNRTLQLCLYMCVQGGLVYYVMALGQSTVMSYDHSANPMEPYIQVAVQPFLTLADLLRVLF